jgi:hypothetical protein
MKLISFAWLERNAAIYHIDAIVIAVRRERGDMEAFRNASALLTRCEREGAPFSGGVVSAASRGAQTGTGCRRSCMIPPWTPATERSVGF